MARSKLAQSLIDDKKALAAPAEPVKEPKEKLVLPAKEPAAQPVEKEAPLENIPKEEPLAPAEPDLAAVEKKERDEAFANLRKERDAERKERQELQQRFLEMTKPKEEPKPAREYKDLLHLTPEEQYNLLREESKAAVSDELKSVAQLREELELQKVHLRWKHEKAALDAPTQGSIEHILQGERKLLEQQNPTMPKYWIDEQLENREAATVRQLKERFKDFPNPMVFISAYINDVARGEGYAYTAPAAEPTAPAEERLNLNERRTMKEQTATLNGLSSTATGGATKPKAAEQLAQDFLNAPGREAVKMKIRQSLRQAK